MLKIMFDCYFFCMLKKVLLCHCRFSPIAYFTTRNNVGYSVTNVVVNSIQSIVEKWLTSGSFLATVSLNIPAVETFFLTNIVKCFKINFKRVISLFGRTFNAVKCYNKISSITAFFKGVTNKSLTSTTTRFNFSLDKYSLFYLSMFSTNANTLPVCSFSLATNNGVSFYSSKKTKFLSCKINSFHGVLLLDTLYHKNKVGWYAGIY